MRCEINEKLDEIADRLGQNGASAELLNALHACRPGHPWNGVVARPFRNLAFMLTGRPLLVDGNDLRWIEKMAISETA